MNHIVVGASNQRSIPDFFMDGIGARVTRVDSPNFVIDPQNKSVRIWMSIFIAFFRLRKYLRSIRIVHRLVQADKPDVIINFYDFIGGIYNKLKSPGAEFICIASPE